MKKEIDIRLYIDWKDYEHIHDSIVLKDSGIYDNLKEGVTIELILPESYSKLSDFIKEWIKLWPTAEMLTRYNAENKVIIEPRQIEKKMKTFFKDFKKNTLISCTFEEKVSLINKATTEYINDFKTGRMDWMYLMKAANFIQHAQKGSHLVGIIVKNKETKKVSGFNPEFKFS